VIIPPGGIARNAGPEEGRAAGQAVHSSHVDPLDQHTAGLDGMACAVCEGSVPGGSIHLLARRDDLAFVQVACPACESTSLVFVLVEPAAAPDGRTAPAPVSGDDVLDMHVLLRGWRGGLTELLGRPSMGTGPGS
jgi:hypothetical protein